jgi:hypothetical protein
MGSKKPIGIHFWKFNQIQKSKLHEEILITATIVGGLLVQKASKL